MGKFEPIVLVHGGAADVPASRFPLKIAGVKRSVLAGYEALSKGGNALDAIEAAIHVMEDDEAFNAGRGSVLNTDGKVEMDAIVMEGKTMKFGAVGALRNMAHPITVARMVMEKTPHVMLAGEGAFRFAREQGLPYCPDEDLVTEFAKKHLNDYKATGKTTNELGGNQTEALKKKIGTVGAVVIDSDGNLACGTSTGGTSGKLPGRVGDTPLPGCGGYCNHVGAVSVTGTGETLARSLISMKILLLVENGLGPSEATKKAFEDMQASMGGSGGGIVITAEGNVGFEFVSKSMAWAYRKGSVLHYGIERGEDNEEVVD